MSRRNNGPNGFIMFTNHWKQQQGRYLTMTQATTEAGKIWSNMTIQERTPFKERAKEEKLVRQRAKNKISCVGIPLKQIQDDKSEVKLKIRNDKRIVEQLVNDSIKNNELKSKSYFFISGNFFTKQLGMQGHYVPAELGLIEFSLLYGVIRKFHRCIAPKTLPYGQLFEAEKHANSTHKLPLPPNAFGQSKMSIVYNDMLNFIARSPNATDEPVLFTYEDAIPIVESIFDYILNDSDASSVRVRIVSVQYLFYLMKVAACEAANLPEKPQNHYCTDEIFNHDFFEYQIGIGCPYHESVDKSRYCSLSIVTRWGYTFADYICRDLDIPLAPHRHLPINANGSTTSMATLPSTSPIALRTYGKENFNGGATNVLPDDGPSKMSKPINDNLLQSIDTIDAIDDEDKKPPLRPSAMRRFHDRNIPAMANDSRKRSQENISKKMP